MSFDLAVWYEEWPVTGAEARQRLDAVGWDEAAFPPHPNVAAFYDALLDRYPPLETSSDVRVRPWSVTPTRSDRLVVMCISYSADNAVIRFIVDRAREMDLVLFDPQSDDIYLPPRLTRRVRLTAGEKPGMTNPDPDVMAHQVRKALLAGSYAVLEDESNPQVHVLAGSGAAVNLAGPGFAVEHRLGGPDSRYRLETDDLDVVIAAFDSFLRDDVSYLTNFGWRPYRG